MTRLTELQFADAVVDLAHIHGWACAGFRAAKTEKGWRTPVRYDAEGWPDLTLAHPHLGIIFAEVKVPPNRVTKPQQDWLHLLQAAAGRCGRHGLIEAVVWRPGDADRIIARLSNGTTTRWRLT